VAKTRVAKSLGEIHQKYTSNRAGDIGKHDFLIEKTLKISIKL
jgi:hypothetical protein